MALAVLLGAPPALAAPIPSGSSALALNPKHGRPTAPFTAAFKAMTGDHKCPQGQALFYWDGTLVATAPFSATCVASKSIIPPGTDRGPGLHTVTAAAEGGLSASDSYTIELVSTPSATRSPSPTPKSTPTTGAPTPSETRATPTTAAPTDSALSSPELDSPTAAPVVVPAASGMPAAGSGGSGLSALALTGGAGLVLVGVVAMGLLFLNSRRHAAEDDLADAAVDPNAETQTDLRPVGLDGLLPRHEPGPMPQPETG